MAEENSTNVTPQEVLICGKNCSGNGTAVVQTCGFPLELIYFITCCMILSAICAIFISIVYSCISEFRNLHGKILVSISVCLATAYTFLLLGSYLRAYVSDVVCVCFGTLTYVMFIASFYWMNALSYDIWKGISNKTLLSIAHHKRQYLKYSCYAWTLTVFTSLPMIVAQNTDVVGRFHPKLGAPVCWIVGKEASLVYLSLPVGLILVANIVMFVMTMKILIKVSNATGILHLNQQRNNVKLYAKLYLVMGLLWVSDFVHAVYPDCYLELAADILCSLHGVCLFLVYVCKRNVIKKLCHQRNGDPASNSLQLT